MIKIIKLKLCNLITIINVIISDKIQLLRVNINSDLDIINIYKGMLLKPFNNLILNNTQVNLYTVK